MKIYLENNYTEDIINENTEPSFRAVFFRIYDRKIASGEITFSSIKMSKDAFICLSTAQDPELSRDDIINLCINMELSKEEAEQMMLAAGYGRI